MKILFLSGLGSAVPLTARTMTILFYGISNIFFCCSCPKVFRINAGTIIARMAHAKSWWNLSVIMNLPRIPVSKNTFITNFKSSVSGRINHSFPNPAIIRLLYEIEESLFRRFGSVLVKAWDTAFTFPVYFFIAIKAFRVLAGIPMFGNVRIPSHLKLLSGVMPRAINVAPRFFTEVII